MKLGILYKFGSFWIGIHYSKYNKRYCVNIIPCVTIWITKKGGKTPHKAYQKSNKIKK